MQSLQIPSDLKGRNRPDVASPQSCRTGLTHRSREPSESPYSDQGNPFADDESDTSGQDEFHLERYSQPTEPSKKHKSNDDQLPAPRYRERSESPRKRPRPGLNIITEFPVVPTRPQIRNMVLEQVPKQRPQFDNRAVASVISQKAEHCYQPSQEGQRPRQTDGVNLTGVESLQRKDKKDNSKIRMPFGGNITTQLAKLATSKKSQREKDGSPADRSIVIGISVPEDQAELHKPKDLSSALSLYTPATPQIVVTPAADEAPWMKPVATSRKRPASSVYSQITHSNNRQYKADEDAPPVPYLTKSDAFHYVTQTRADPRTDQTPRPVPQYRPVSTDTVFDDQEDIANLENRQASAATDEESIPLTGDSARPRQSKGWWDLALTPMLSRAGSKFARRSPSEPSPVPPVPRKSPYIGQKSITPDTFDEPLLSPETPRRLGMGSGHASTAGWTNWTEWEEERNRAAKSTAPTSEDNAWKGHTRAQESGATVPFMISATPVTKGLAAEYFQACAFDQRGAEPYFECQNHSCGEKLPKLVSIHDRIPEVEPASRTEKGMLVDVPAPVPQTTTARDHALEKLEGNEPTTPRVRSDSNSTAIDDEPVEFSPNMRSANVATIMKPTAFAPTKPLAVKSAHRAIEEPEEVPNTTRDVVTEPTQETPLPTYYSAPARSKPQVAAFGASFTDPWPAVESPGPLSPEGQRDIAPREAVLMSEVDQTRNPRASPQPIFINNYTTYPEAPSRTDHAPISLADIEQKYDAPPTRALNEKQDKPKRNFFGWLSCMKRKKEDEAKKKKKRTCICLIFWGLLAIVIACIVLAITLTRKGDNTPINTQWLNLTGFPPMPTGISTVIRPDVLNADNSCVSPSTLWSCAVPKEQASDIAPNDPDQPNFRFEIRFHNGTSGVNPAGTVPVNGTGTSSTSSDPFTNDLFTPNPAPPSGKEQIFLGNTTDQITEPFDGEVTPFFITLVSAFPVVPSGFDSSSSSRRSLEKRESSTNTSLSLPAPSTTSDGAPAPAQLLPEAPFPSSQPLRLYNRDLPTEHYGFYTYFSKTIFLSTASVTNNTLDASAVLPDDENGGSFQAQAAAMCTFTQTRLKVAIFTNPASGLSLLPGDNTSTVAGNNPADTAFDYDPPGSFPYPMAVTLDRHGGDAAQKAVFCYKMLDGAFVEPLVGVLQAEFRGSGGTLVNSAPSLVAGAGDNGFDGSLGGVDGGTGGCQCEWGNFVGTTG